MQDNPRLKLEWAYNKIPQFEAILRLFVRANPYAIVGQRDPQTQEVVYRATKDATIPVELSLMAGDILQNLRSALDYLAHALVLANGKTPTTQTGFPILEDAPTTPKLKRTFERKVEGIRKEAVDLISAFKPYKGGNDALWCIQGLNNIDKHRLLPTAAGCIGGLGITQHIDATDMPLDHMERVGRAMFADDFETKMRYSTFPLYAGREVWVDPPNSKVNQNPQFIIEVAINEPGVCEAEPIQSVLGKSFNAVMQVLKAFKGRY